MIDIDLELTPDALRPDLERFWEVSGGKIARLIETYPEEAGTPVFTAAGRYTAQGWTEWTQGFLYGWSILQFDATGDERYLEMGRRGTVEKMASHVTHIGVHDHGFNNVSTYGNLRRLMLEGRIPFDRWELDFYEIALKASGAVQAARWSRLIDGTGFIHTFNGPHSLFCDTIRSVRALMLSHELGHALMGENDERFSLLDRGLQHAANTARYVVFYGEGRDAYDEWGRVAHEAVFNMKDGRFRNSSTQQGYSPFSTWTRGLAWIMSGYAEELEFIATLPDEDLEPYGGREEIEAMMLKAARASCDFYIANSPTDGVPYWDTGAPGLALMGDYLDRPSDPTNDHEPIDSSAAAIGCQGLMRLGRFLSERGDPAGERYFAAGLTVLRTLLREPYLSADPAHQGLLLHGIYHRPRGWDYQPPGSAIPCGEAVMWGDYHLVEAALYTGRLASGAPYYTFFGS